MDTLVQLGYVGMFISSFLAATILPFSSEIILSSLLLNNLNPYSLVIIATIGNVLGSVINYLIGVGSFSFFEKKIFNKNKKSILKAINRYKKFGPVFLLFAWVPIIGDPLTVAAGILKTNFKLFLVLVTTGKLARYVFLSYCILKVWN